MRSWNVIFRRYNKRSVSHTRERHLLYDRSKEIYNKITKESFEPHGTLKSLGTEGSDVFADWEREMIHKLETITLEDVMRCPSLNNYVLLGIACKILNYKGECEK